MQILLVMNICGSTIYNYIYNITDSANIQSKKEIQLVLLK